MIKRSFFIFLALVLAVSLIIGCAPAPTPTPAPTPKPTPTPTPTPTPVSPWDAFEGTTIIMDQGCGATHASFKGLTPYFEKLEEISGGKIKTRVFSGGVLVGLRGSLKGLREDVCDASHMVISYFPADLPASNLIPDALLNLGNGVAAAGATAEILTLHSSFFEEESIANNVYMWGTYGTQPYVLHSTEPRTTLADMKGMKVRTGGPAWVREADALGAIAVNIPASDAYEGMMRGTLDAVWGPGDYQRSFGLWDVANHVTYMPLGLFNAVVTPCFTRTFVDSLPDVAKIALIENFAILPASITLLGYRTLEVSTKKTAEEKGTKYSEAAPDLVAACKDFIAKDTAGLIDLAVENRGLDRAKASVIIKLYISLYEKWEKLADEVIKNDNDKFIEVLKAEVYHPYLVKLGLK